MSLLQLYTQPRAKNLCIEQNCLHDYDPWILCHRCPTGYIGRSLYVFGVITCPIVQSVPELTQNTHMGQMSFPYIIVRDILVLIQRRYEP